MEWENGEFTINWNLEKTNETIRCSNCGMLAQFTEKTEMRFIMLFFVIPIFPVGRKKKMIECPNCRAKFQSE